MKRFLLLSALLMTLAAVSPAAAAINFVREYAAIDAALAKHPELTDEQLADVKKHRERSETYYKAGATNAATQELQRAERILGIAPTF